MRSKVAVDVYNSYILRLCPPIPRVYLGRKSDDGHYTSDAWVHGLEVICTCGATGGRRYKYITIIESGRELPHNIGMCNGENLLVI